MNVMQFNTRVTLELIILKGIENNERYSYFQLPINRKGQRSRSHMMGDEVIKS